MNLNRGSATKRCDGTLKALNPNQFMLSPGKRPAGELYFTPQKSVENGAGLARIYDSNNLFATSSGYKRSCLGSFDS